MYPPIFQLISASTDAKKALGTSPTRLYPFGTEKMPAQRFMRPALSDNVMKASDAFIAEYDKRLARAIKRGA